MDLSATSDTVETEDVFARSSSCPLVGAAMAPSKTGQAAVRAAGAANTRSNANRLRALAEQAIVSLANFTAFVLLARLLPKSEYGAFSLAFAVYLFASGVHRALVVIPLSVQGSSAEELSTEATFWRRLQLRVTVAISVLLLASGAVMPVRWWREALIAGALIVVANFYQDFLRRWLIGREAFAWLLGSSIVYAFLYVGAVLVVVPSHPNVYAATFTLVFATSVGVVVALLSRPFRATATSGSWSNFRRNQRTFVRWSISSHLAYTGYNSANQFIIASFVGPVGLSAFTATQTLLKPISTLIMAVDNVDKMWASRRLAEGGVRAMLQSLRNTRTTLLVLGGSYLALLALGARPALHLVYDGKYDAYAPLLWLWIAVHLLMLVGQPLEAGLYVLKRPDLLFRARLIAAGAGILAAFALVPPLGATGGLLALAVGWAVATFEARRRLEHASAACVVAKEAVHA